MIANHPHANKRPIAQGIASLGRGNDTMLVHMTPQEVQGLQKLAMAHGGSLTINPHTGLPEAGFLSMLLPLIAGAALGPAGFGLMSAGMAGATVGLATTAITGSLKKGIMSGLGAYGGSSLAEGLTAAGAATPAVTPANTLPTGITTTPTPTGALSEFSLGQPSQLGMQNLSGQGIASQGLQAGMPQTAIANSASSLGASAPVSSGLGALNEYGIPMSAQMPGTESLTPLSPSVAGIQPPVPTPTPNVNPNDVKPFGYNPTPVAAAPVEASSAAKLAPQSVYSPTPSASAPTPPATPSSFSNMGKGISNLASPDSATSTAAQKAFGTKAGISTAIMAAAPILTNQPTLKGGIGSSPSEYYNTSYSPGERNPNFGKAGEPYYINQGFTKGTYDKTAKIAGGGSIGSEPEDEGEVIPESNTATFGGYDDSYGKLSGKSLDYALKSRNPHIRAQAQVEAKRRGISDQTMSAAAGGSIRGYDEGGDVRPQGGIAALAQQQPYQSPFQIQRDTANPAQLNQYMTNLNKSLQGAPAQQYSAPSYTPTGTTSGDQSVLSSFHDLMTGESSNVPTYSYTPPKPVAPSWMAPVLPPDQAPVSQPATQPTAQPITQPTAQPTFQLKSPIPNMEDAISRGIIKQPDYPTYDNKEIKTTESGRSYIDTEDSDSGRKYISPEDINPLDWQQPAYQKFVDAEKAKPPEYTYAPTTQPTYTPPTSQPTTQQPTSQPSGGGMVTDQWGNSYYEPAPPPPPAPTPTADVMPSLPFGYQDDNGNYVGYDNNLHVMPRSTDSDTGGIASLIPPDSAPMGGDLRGMVQPPIPQPQTPPPPPPAPEVPTYQGNQVYTNEDGQQVYRDSEDGRERRVPDDSPSSQEKEGGSIKAKKYAMGGIATLQTYAAGGKLLNGDGDGMSDSIPAVINGPRPQRAALADGEFVIPADVVSHLGNGSTKAGAKKLYQMLDRVRVARVGNKKQGKQINPNKFMPA